MKEQEVFFADKSRMEQKRNNKGALTVMLLLSIAGVILSLIALQQHLSVKADASYESFCDIGGQFSCSAVAGSAYSTIFGIPLASYGIVFYSVLAFLSSLGAFAAFSVVGPLLVLSLFSVLLSVYLYILSSLYIKALCLLCIGLYGVNVLLLLASFYTARGSATKTFKGGVRSIFSFPRTLLGKDSPASSAAFIGFLFTIGVAVLTLQLPKFIGPVKKKASASVAADVVTSMVAEWENQTAIPPVSLQTEGDGKDYTLGDSTAPVTIVEFSDFECPACQGFYPVIKGIINKHKEKVHFVFKNYPLDMECNPAFKQPVHNNACFSAFASRCAGEQGRFWEAVEVLIKPGPYEVGTPEVVRDELLKKLEKAGVKLQELEACISSGRHREKILQDIQEGDRYGLRGTPSVWVNGKKVPSIRADVLEAVVLKAAGEK